MASEKRFDDSLLPDGTKFKSWEKPAKFSRTYYVDGTAAHADDTSPGTEKRPFRTISAAAKVLEPGERVVIATGTYRECVRPSRGGSAPGKMISYEAAPGARVLVKGSALLRDGWKPSSGWQFARNADKVVGKPRIWEIRLDRHLFDGYNPFAMVNILQDRAWLDHCTTPMEPFLARRGLLFVDGKPLRQVELYPQLALAAGQFWIEDDGLALHMRLTDDGDIADHEIEITTQEQVFAPEERFLGYIRVKGLTLMHAASGFPVPQRGLLSTARGHHWIIEGCTVEWANSVGIDVGKEHWHAASPKIPGHHIIRRNIVRHCGICGLAGLDTQSMLVDDNLFEHCAFHPAEHMYESAAVKFHAARGMLFRHNLIRHITHACGLWLDCAHDNCRVTGNTFTDIATVSGAIHLEGNHGTNWVDHNVVVNVATQPKLQGGECGGKGMYLQGTDNTLIAHNLITNCQAMGIRIDIIPNRIIGSHGGLARKNQIINNVLIHTGRSAIEFENPDNFSDGNFFAGQPAGFLRLDGPPFPELLDLESWRDLHGWDIHGHVADLSVKFDAQSLQLEIQGSVPKANRRGGPFAALAGKHSIDPRGKPKNERSC